MKPANARQKPSRPSELTQADLAQMPLASAVLTVQQCYPTIWFACHRGHQTRSNSAHQLTDRELGVLAHVAQAASGQSRHQAKSKSVFAQLSAHLGIGKAALSVHLQRLAQMALISIAADPDHKRRKSYQINAAGLALLQAHGPLDGMLVHRLLQQLSAKQLKQALLGLELLAQASKQMATGENQDHAQHHTQYHTQAERS